MPRWRIALIVLVVLAVIALIVLGYYEWAAVVGVGGGGTAAGDKGLSALQGALRARADQDVAAADQAAQSAQQHMDDAAAKDGKNDAMDDDQLVADANAEWDRRHGRG